MGWFAGAAVLAVALGAGPFTDRHGAPAVAAAPNPFCETPTALSLTPTMPRAMKLHPGLGDQGFVDCIAWQEFIYLNWRAQPGSIGQPDRSASPASFGLPVTSRSAIEKTVWESYHSADELFAPPALRAVKARPGRLLLAAIDKFQGNAVSLNGTQEATGGWLTSQTGQLTFYEIRIDNDEYAYFTDPNNNLTSVAAQVACAKSKFGLQLPHGKFSIGQASPQPDVDCRGNTRWYGDQIGAIELKAAWLPLPNDPAVWSKYLITVADVLYPGTTTPKRDVVVGLVGLHIIHKVPGAEQFLWATFEHIDNAPDPSQAGSPAPAVSGTPGPWTYYNPQSTAPPNVQPGVPCPAPGCQPYSVPVQVLRIAAIPGQAVAATAAFNALLGNNPSVFRNYELVNVQWPSASVAVKPGARRPLPNGGSVPALRSTIPPQVANTTLETYFQDHSCLFCHSGATIATPQTRTVRGRPLIEIVNVRQRKPGGYGSDYSFLFRNATRP
jgi:hypothetical protein